MPLPLLATLLWGTASVQVPAPSPQLPAAAPPVRAQESEAARIRRLRTLVEAAEKALEADEDEAATARSDEAEVLTADWPAAQLGLPEVQALLQRLKDVQDQLAAADPSEAEPGLKAGEEVVSIQGEELQAELARVRAAEQGASYDFPIDLNDKVLTWVSLFSTTKKGFMENALGRASMYLPMVRQVFAEEGIPTDLAYLAVIESGYRNEAKSRAKAVGMWQFIRSTGRIYGLTANAWVEERRDPIKATRAAARYLKRLYQTSGDWYLAVSGYNAGPLTLDRAIQNLGTRNFWDLARSRWLRTETKNYVPELCAAILVGRNPERYGLNVVPLPPYTYETVSVPAMTSLSVLARCAGTDAATLKALNPELLRGTTPKGTYALRVPPGKAMDCLRQLAGMPSGKRLDFQGYLVRKGDTLAKVARRFRVSQEDLLEANDLSAKQFRPGARILVPPPAPTADRRDLPASGMRVLEGRPLPSLPVQAEIPGPALPEEVHATGVTAAPTPHPEPGPSVPSGQVLRARPGDTLARLARAHSVPLGELMRLNPGALKALRPGDPIRLPGGAREPRPAPPPAPKRHRVQQGETLAAIARRYRVEVADLKAWNGLKHDRIQAGQSLRLSPR